jgi:hypothetical protein
MPEAVAAYVARAGTTKVVCTNRHQTVTIYGHSSGSVTIHRQHPDTQSCVYDGTHY